MITTHSQRLQTMLRSMVEVVIPALGSDRKLAQDQAAIIVGNLQVLLDQSDRSYHFLVCELKEYRELVQDLSFIVGPTEMEQDSTQSASSPDLDEFLKVKLPGPQELAALVTVLKTHADDLVVRGLGSGDPEAHDRIYRLVLKQSAKQVERERSWLRSTGFDSNIDSVPGIDDVLGIAGSQAEGPEANG